ncbi:MAG: sugar transferase [Phycisphaerae bacterium]
MVFILFNGGLPARGGVLDDDSPVQWHCRTAQDHKGSPFLILPERLRSCEESLVSSVGNASLIWYADELSLSLPEVSGRADVWVVNGAQWPIFDWDTAHSTARRCDCDVLVFGSPQWATDGHYWESLQTDRTGHVVRLSRHYTDSQASVDRWTGSASCLVCSGARVRAVLAHLVVHGWGLDSIGSLTRRFRVGWANGQKDEGERMKDENRGVASIHPSSFYRFGKRSMDVILSALALILLSVPLLVVAALVKLTSRGPVLYGHKRQGLGGNEFRCLKFRTMIEGAEAMQDQMRGDNEVDGPQFKIAEDPRLTRLGAWLRRYNVDELPQLINVLKGEMSLVGPRPSPDDENQFCPGWRRARLSVRPGITGLWQVMRLRNQSESDFQEWIYYDLEYVQHRSLWLDWQLLLHTPLAMFASGRLGRFARCLQQRGICVHSARVRQDAPSAREASLVKREASRSGSAQRLTDLKTEPRPLGSGPGFECHAKTEPQPSGSGLESSQTGEVNVHATPSEKCIS